MGVLQCLSSIRIRGRRGRSGRDADSCLELPMRAVKRVSVLLCVFTLLLGAATRLALADEPKEPTQRQQRQAIDDAVKAQLDKEIDIDVIETPFSDVCR